VKKKFFYITITGLLIIGAIIYLTANNKTISALENINKKLFLTGVLFYLLMNLADAARTKILLKGTGDNISMLESLELVATLTFFNLITPFSFGGQPFQIYILHKKGIPAGNASIVVITKLLFGAVALMGVVLYALIFYPHILGNSTGIRLGIKITSILIILMSILFVIGIYNTKTIVKLISKLNNILKRFHILKKNKNYTESIEKQLILARESFTTFLGKKFGYFLSGFILSFITILSNLLMIVFFILSFHIKINILEATSAAGLLIFVVTFLPTPGANGLGEGVFYLIFRQYTPTYIIGVIIFLWKFFHHYLTSAVGFVVSIKYFTDLLNKKN